MRRVMVALTGLFCLAPAMAQDNGSPERPVKAGLLVNGIDGAFESAAGSVGQTTVIYNEQCRAEGATTVCQYDGKGPIQIWAMGASAEAEAESIWISYVPDDNPIEFIWNLGLLVLLCEPDMAKEKRGAIVQRIVDQAVENGGTVKGEACVYSSGNVGAIMITATAS